MTTFKWRSLRTVAVAAFGLCFAPPALAEQTTGAVSVLIENDSFTGSDDAYSSGVGMIWTSRNVNALSTGNPAREWANLWSAMPGVKDPGAERYVSLTIAQEIHTPADITLASPPLDDRPYAGILYLDSVVYRRSRRMTDAWSLRLGVVGPASGAEQTQTWIHNVIGADEPLGWDTQLPNEPVANLGYTAAFRGPSGELSKRVRWRVTPTVSADAGTYATLAGAGMLLEFGYNLPASVGAVSSLRGGMNSAGVVGWSEDETGMSLTGNLGVAGYAVDRFLPLDGTIFRESRSVGYDPYVTVLTVGATLRFADYALNFNVAYSSDDTGGRGDGVEFGTLTLSKRFR